MQCGRCIGRIKKSPLRRCPELFCLSVSKNRQAAINARECSSARNASFIRRVGALGRRALLFRTDTQSKSLEVKSQRKLQIALAAANSSPFGKHFPEGVEIGGIESDITCVRVTPATATPIRMVDKVEGFSPELEPSLLVDGEVLIRADR